jgi:topoisomerase-4 subunit A
VKVLRSGGRGSRLIELAKGEALLQVLVCGEHGVVLSGTGRAAKPMSRSLNVRELNEFRGLRGRKGLFIEPRWKDCVLTAHPAALPPGSR